MLKRARQIVFLFAAVAIIAGLARTAIHSPPRVVATASFDGSAAPPRRAPPSTIGDHVYSPEPRTPENFACLVANDFWEARGENVAGREAILSVVVNRVRSPFWANTLCGVVWECQRSNRGCQFSWTNGRARGSYPRFPRHETAAYERSLALIERFFREGVPNRVGGADHYHATWMRRWPNWGIPPVGTVGVHIFFDDPRR